MHSSQQNKYYNYCITAVSEQAESSPTIWGSQQRRPDRDSTQFYQQYGHLMNYPAFSIDSLLNNRTVELPTVPTAAPSLCRQRDSETLGPANSDHTLG